MITAYKNKQTIINTLDELNSSSNGNWVIGGTIQHNNNLGSYVDLPPISSLIEGDTYRVSYTISSYGNCKVNMYLGTTKGIDRTSAGTFVENIIFTGPKKLRFYATGNATISYYKIDHLVKIVDETPVSPNEKENLSWTLSFNPILNQWISYHSYLPNNYITHPNKLLAKRNDIQIQLTNSGEFGKYFDDDIKPFIIETIFNQYPTETKVFDSIHSCVESKLNEVVTNKFFDKGIIYTENQCSGEITLNLSNLTKKEKNWSINRFSDITNNLSQSIFVKDWNSIKSSYPIDKVVNVNKIDDNKPWYQRGRFRDKYMAVRFIENNLENSKLFVKFVISYIRLSQR